MSVAREKSRKRIYTVLGLVSLAYTLVGSFVSFTTVVDYFGPPAEYTYDVRNNPIVMGLIFLVTGIPLFLLFLFLERRASRNTSS
jgi:hypothetical protein